MQKRILAIAKNTFWEAVRDKILYGIVAFAFLFIGAMAVLGTLSLGEDLKIIKDLGLAGIYFFGLIITIFMAASVMYREISQRTIYILMAKPVSVFEIVVGKFFGLLASSSLTIFLMAAVYLATVLIKGGGFDLPSLQAIGLQMGEMSIIISAALMFSLLSTPLTAVIYGVCLVYIGHTLDFLLGLERLLQISSTVQYSTKAMYYILPNLEKFNIRDLVVHQKLIPLDAFLIAYAYAALYSALLLYTAGNILRKREL